MATKKMKKITSLTPKLNKRMGVSTSESRVRHISSGIKYPQPICGEVSNSYYRPFVASDSPKRHKLPICKKCSSLVLKAYNDLTNDPAYIEATTTPEQRDQKLKDSHAAIVALLEEYGGDLDEDGEISA